MLVWDLEMVAGETAGGEGERGQSRTNALAARSRGGTGAARYSHPEPALTSIASLQAGAGDAPVKQAEVLARVTQLALKSALAAVGAPSRHPQRQQVEHERNVSEDAGNVNDGDHGRGGGGGEVREWTGQGGRLLFTTQLCNWRIPGHTRAD